MQREPWCKVAPGGEDRSRDVKAGKGCKSLKSKPKSSVCHEQLVKEDNRRKNWNLCRRGSITAERKHNSSYSCSAPTMAVPANGQWAVLRGRRGPVGLGSIPFLPTPSHPTPCILAPHSAPQRCSAWTHLCLLAVTSVPMKGSKRAFLAWKEHVSDCVHSDITAVEAREQTTYSSVRY